MTRPTDGATRVPGSRCAAALLAALCTMGVHPAFAQAEFFPIDGGHGATVNCQVNGPIERTGRAFGSAPSTVTGCTLGQDAPFLLDALNMSLYCKGGFPIQFHPGTTRLKSCALAFDTALKDRADASVSCKAGVRADFDADGRLVACNGGGSSTIEPQRPRASEASHAGGVPFTVENAPFRGEMPAAWTSHRDAGGAIVFEAPKGTEASLATVELEVAPRASLGGKSLDEIARVVARAIAGKPSAVIDEPEARSDGVRRAMAIRASYAGPGDRGLVVIRHISVVVDYPDHVAVFTYYAPDEVFERFAPLFQQIGNSFQYIGR